MGSSILPTKAGAPRYIPPLTLALGVLTPVADDPSSGAVADPELSKLGNVAFGS